MPASLNIDGQLQSIHLLVTRSTPRCAMVADTFFACLEQLKTQPKRLDAAEIHSSIVDPEHPIRYFLDF